jgi:hypothetical protein
VGGRASGAERSHFQFISSEWCHPSELRASGKVSCFPFREWAAAAECVRGDEQQNMLCKSGGRTSPREKGQKQGRESVNNNSYIKGPEQMR